MGQGQSAPGKGPGAPGEQKKKDQVSITVEPEEDAQAGTAADTLHLDC